jgi:hypothetical protein
MKRFAPFRPPSFMDQYLHAPVNMFLNCPSEESERDVIVALNQVLRLPDYENLPDAFIEWGCLEHDLIHVCAYYGQQWIQITRSGVVSCL